MTGRQAVTQGNRQSFSKARQCVTGIRHFSRHVLCWVLSLTIALQPNLVEANSAVITVDPNSTATVDTTINNTPLLQIEAPNASGISHNKFTDFNVGKPGLVINNALRNTTTNIGGAILKNPNFSGTAASLILNEVTSANRSSLSGFTEIAGEKADYILANPNGITCNGCGFINTSRSTLTTGTPTFSGTALESLSVNGGDVIVNALGLNAMETDAFDIITRAATITGAINANELNIIAGRNDVKYSDRTVTKKADDGSTKPTLAIDSSVLGGMYAGRIALVANETGVGVNMQGEMAASTSDLTLTADGRIDLKTATAKTDLTVTSQTAVDVATRAYGENDLSITAPVLDATGATVAAGNDVTLSGSTITGTNAQLIAGLQSDGSNAAQGTIKVAALGGSFAYDGGMIRAGKDVNLEAATVNGGASSNGISSLGNTTIKGTTSAALSGNINVGGNLSLTGGILSTTSGTGDVTGTAIINGTSYSGGNALEAGGDITVTTTGDTDIQTGGGLTSNGAVSINARNITSDGTISSQTGTTLTATQALTTSANAKTQSAANTTLTSTNDMTLGGTTTAANELTINAQSLTNNGTIADGRTSGAAINVTTNLTNTGLIYASGDMKLIVPMTLLNDEGQILAGGSIQIDKDGAGAKNTKVWNYSGNIESLNGGITISTAELLNERKDLVETTTVLSSSSSKSVHSTVSYGHASGDSRFYTNTSSMISDGNYRKGATIYRFSSSSTSQYSATSTKQIPKIISKNDLSISADTITNKSGQIHSNANLTLQGNTLTNTGYASATISHSSSTSPKVTSHSGDVGGLSYGVSAGPTSTSSSTVISDPGDTFITAGGNITGSFTDKIDNISVKTGAGAVSITEGTTNVHATSADIGIPTKETINSGITIPTKGLFLETKDPAAEFIIETNPAVNTVGALYGSDYFTQRAGINLASEVKRLGNDDWETRVVRDQIMAVTHKRFLSNTITNDSDQYKSLMDNALAQHEDLKLSYGVALTADQVAALTSDLVWNVEVTLADGRKALKPVVYFSNATRIKIDSSGALISAGGDINLAAANDVNNSGTLSGGNVTLASTEGSVTNEYGKLEAANGNLEVTADQNIANTGGLITGDNVTLTATNGDFTNTTEVWRQSRTLKRNLNGVWGNNRDIEFNDVTGARARISAANGNVTINAGKNITDSGATQLAAANDITLTAGEDVTLKTLNTQTRSVDRYKQYEGTQTVKQNGADLKAGNNLTITSGAQASLLGTKVETGNDLSISSGADTIITAAKTTTTVDHGDGGYGNRISTRVTNDLAALKSGGDLKITSGENIVGQGVTLAAANDVNLASESSTTLTGVQNTFKKDIVGKKYELHIDKRDTVQSSITAGNNISIQSGEDVNVKGSTVVASNAINVQADNDVNITNLQNVDIRKERTSKKGFMSSSSTTSESYKEKTVSSVLGAGGNININAGEDISVRGSEIVSNKDVTLKAGTSGEGTGDITLAASQDRSFSSTTTTKSSGFNLGLVSYNSMEGSAKQNSNVTNVASVVQGENITVQTGTDLTIKGSRVDASKDASIDVAGNLNIENEYDTSESSSFSYKASSLNATLPVYYFDINIGKNSLETKADNVYDKTVVASRVTSGNDLNISVGQDAAITGSEVQAEGDLNLTVEGNLDLTTAQNVHSESHSQSKQSGFTVGVSYNGFGVNVGQTKIKGEERSTLDIINEGTLLKAEKDLNVQADNITIVSGELASGQDTNIEAENDIVLATAQDVHQTSVSQTTGKTTSVGGSYGKSFSGGEDSKNGLNARVGVNASKGKLTTNTTTVTDTIQQGTDLNAGNDINITSGNDTTLVNTDVNAGGEVNVEAGGDVNLLAAADTHETENSTSTTKTSSTGVTLSVSADYDNGGRSADGAFTTGSLTTGVTQTKSTTTTTTTTTTDTVYKGTSINSEGGTTIVAANDVSVENTETTGEVLSENDTVTAGGEINETTLEDTSVTVTTSTTTSTSSTDVITPDLKQFVLDTVANAVGEVGANKIGDMKAGEKKEDGTREKGIDAGTQKALHALNGALQAAISSEGDLKAIASGAAGAVIAEIAAESYIKQEGLELLRQKEAGEISLAEYNRAIDEAPAKAVKFATFAAKLGVGLSGGDMDIAAWTGQNAASNNAVGAWIRGLKTVGKIGKKIYQKGGDISWEDVKKIGKDEVMDLIDAGSVIVDPTASAEAKLLAALEVALGVEVDAKDVGKVKGWALQTKDFIKNQNIVDTDTLNFVTKIDIGKLPSSLDRITTSGVKLVADPNKTTTVLGKFDTDIKYILEESKYPKTLDFDGKTGGFNILNAPDNKYKSPKQFWNEFNKPFLDKAISRGDNIVLATKPTDSAIFKPDGTLSGFGEEMKYLKKRGYEHDPISNLMIKVK